MRELTARVELPHGTLASKHARDAVESLLRNWGFHHQRWLELTRVVVSELVSNAMIHGGGCLQLDVRAHGSEVTIGAADAADAAPRRREAGPDGGFGLRLIEALVSRWGVDEHEHGKRVWVQLPPPPPPHAPGQPSSAAEDQASTRS